jgi:glycosyltransferase involved in cell wall biosynthesis
MRILVTTDTLGGVWTYTRELVTGLTRRGVQVTLVSFGDIPTPGQTTWMEQLPELDYRPTAFKLEWMQNSEADMEASAEYLRDRVREAQPDVVHLNQFYYGTLACEAPKVVVAHSDVVSWWLAVHGEEPPTGSWLNWYRNLVTDGLAGASEVVAPSRWMLDQVESLYVKPNRSRVIYNGRTPALFNPYITKADRIVTAGRIWDCGKNAGLLLKDDMPAPVCIVGADRHPDAERSGFAAAQARSNVELLPQQSEGQMTRILARASIYAAPSRYEPFGLAPVEAALSRCAIVASDIPVLRELWQDAAIFFSYNDVQALKCALESLVRDPVLRVKYANLAYTLAREKFTAERMVNEYMELYRTLTPAAVAAA